MERHVDEVKEIRVAAEELELQKELQRLQRAVQKDDRLVLDYQVIVVKESFFGAEQVITRDAHRWSVLDLRTLDWQPVDQSGLPYQIAEGAGHATVEQGRRPQTPVPPFEEIPILPDPQGDYWEELRHAAQSQPLAVCCSGPTGDPAGVVGRSELTVVARSGEWNGELRIASVQIDERRYGAW